MAKDLYAILEVPKSATPEEIRNAYRRRALNTHPDRLPPSASEEERAAKTEQFRQVNNAYQVLSDADTRKEYDRYGVWPPRAAEEVPQRSRHRDPFSDPFFQDPFHNSSFGRGGHFSDPFFGGSSRRARPFEFVDPFDLFEQLFPDMRGMHARATHHNPYRSHHPFSPFDPFGGGGFRNMFQDMHDMNTNMLRSFGGSPSFHDGNGRWESRSYQSVSINGVQQQRYVHRDSQGNEHIKTIGPDGRETYTINGVVQNTLPASQGEHRQIRDRPEGGAAPPPPPPYYPDYPGVSFSSATQSYWPYSQS